MGKHLKYQAKKEITSEEIMNFFGLRNEDAYLLKGIKMSPIFKLTWLREYAETVNKAASKYKGLIAELKSFNR